MTVQAEPAPELARFEENVRRCLDELIALRKENEALKAGSGQALAELRALEQSGAGFKENKARILEKLEMLLERIDSLHIENITND